MVKLSWAMVNFIPLFRLCAVVILGCWNNNYLFKFGNA